MLSSAAAALAPADELLRELLAVSLTGIILYSPQYDPAGSGQITDFAFEYLNPAAQRMMAMPEVPTLTHNQQWPHSIAHGTFQFHVEAFESGEPREYNVNYQADGYDNYYRLAARRAGNGLLVSFTDTADQPRSPVEVALREAQARERSLLAEAERERALLQTVLTQAPVGIGLFQGAAHAVTLANDRICAMWGHPPAQVLGRPLLDGVPELRGQGFAELLDEVARTGQAYVGTEVPAEVARHGQLETRYFDFVFQPVYDADGALLGIFDLVVDVTEQVLARRQLEKLNQELEARVQERTREAEAARAEAEEQRNRLLRLFRQAPAQIDLFTGPDHVWTMVHPHTQQLLPNRRLQGQPRRLALPELPAEQQEPLDRVYRTGQPVQVVESMRRINRFDDGALHDVYFDITFQPTFDASGQIEGVMSFAVNVTERVRARQHADGLQAQVLAAARQQGQEREAFQNVFEQTPALIALLRAPGHRFEYANPAYRAFFPGRQLVGRELAEVTPELIEQGFGPLLDEVYRTGETFFGTELPFTPRPIDGQPVPTAYFNFTYQAYREAGTIAGVSIFAFDVTEQVLARLERETQRRRLLSLFEEAPAGIAILAGPDLVYEFVNPVYQQLVPERALRGLPFVEALPELADNPVVPIMHRVYATGQPHEEDALLIPVARVAHGVPEDRYFSFVYQPRHSDDGQVDGLMVFVFEVTEQVRARQRVQELNEELAAINEELQATNEELGDSNRQLTRTNVDLDNFIYTASHDLKAPISNIEGLLYLLQEELPAGVVQDAEIGPTLVRMLDAVERFKRTIDHLTEVSKLQKEHAPAATAVSLAAVVEDVRQDLLPLLQVAGARLTVAIPNPTLVQFSEKNLRSVVYNLLSNALKYRSPGRTPHIDVRAHARPDHLVLEVHDNGLGIAEAQLPRLFGMFQRFHDHVEGTGIGLYMVKRMVENAGGRVEVHSQLGAGSTFFVFLPHAAAPAA